MNIIQQLSVFLENKAGRVSELTKILGQAGINLSAFTIAESSDFGMMRVVVSEPQRAKDLLKEHGFAVSLTDVVCLQTPNTPGSLNKALAILSENGVGIAYMYAFAEGDHARVILSPDNLNDCVRVLLDNKQRLIDADEIYSF
ncbi:MAG: ACT domain-containing protein [Bacteroidales bacterium]|nr:ACT domain-containing protein [Bacteroidales bacterium]